VVEAGLGLDNIVVHQKNKKKQRHSMRAAVTKCKLYQNLVSWAPYAIFDVFPILFL